ncbi:GNAT family N-acetyltransferase [Streptomyces sp. NPDC004838]
MTDMPRTAHTSQLTSVELAEIRAMLEVAFDGDFSEEDWDHGLGGVHALAYDSEGLAAHGSVIMRRVLHDGRSYRVGYVEALAVRPDRQRQGIGGRMMESLEAVIDRAYVFGALSASPEGAGLYRSRGWRLWPGRIEGLGPAGVEHFAESEDSTYVWGRIPGGSGALTFDWRDGDVL